jgi:plastocyanin
MTSETRTQIGCAALLVVAFASPAWAAGGTVEGKVEAMPAKYLEETVVYLKQVPGSHPPKTVEMDQKGMKFIPHVLAITVGDSVKFLNHDHVDHNVYSPEGGYNLGTWPYGSTKEQPFKKEGAFSQLCSLHPEMLAYVFVGQNPYSAVVDQHGRFVLTDVPPGTYQIAVWNSHLKAAEQRVTVAENKTEKINFSLQR